MRNYPYFGINIFDLDDNMVNWSGGDIRDDLLFSPSIDVATFSGKLSTGKRSSSVMYQKAESASE